MTLRQMWIYAATCALVALLVAATLVYRAADEPAAPPPEIVAQSPEIVTLAPPEPRAAIGVVHVANHGTLLVRHAATGCEFISGNSIDAVRVLVPGTCKGAP